MLHGRSGLVLSGPTANLMLRAAGDPDALRWNFWILVEKILVFSGWAAIAALVLVIETGRYRSAIRGYLVECGWSFAKIAFALARLALSFGQAVRI